MTAHNAHDGCRTILPAAHGSGDGPPPDTCFTKAALARFLGLSVRSLDRAAALGLTPVPDLIVGRSPRWSPDTVTKWLRTRPRLPGRKGGRHD
jgi:hypothetical protein